MSKINNILKYQNGYQNLPSFDDVIHELITHKRKVSHWIWYIIPYHKDSISHGNRFTLSPTDIELYAKNSYLRNNYIFILLLIEKHLKDLQIHQYSRYMSEIDLQKVYESAIVFKKYSKNSSIKYACNEILKCLLPYIERKNQQYTCKKCGYSTTNKDKYTNHQNRKTSCT